MSNMKNEVKEPFVRMAKRDSISSKRAWAYRGIALLGALIVGALLIVSLGQNPFLVYKDMAVGAFGNKIYLQQTVRAAIPLLITSLGVSVAFKMKFWNIGAEGQILIGAIAAMGVGIAGEATTPSVLLWILMAVAGFVAGGLYGVIPAFFKARFNTNETLFTLMLNYIALQFVLFLQYQPYWQGGNSTFPKIKMLTAAARLPKVFGVHIGWIIALILVVVVQVYMTRTKQGFEISVVGESVNTARYAGMNVGKIIVRTMFVSGALAGLAGTLQVSGADGTLTSSTAGGVGFTAIIVAWLAKLNPFAMILVAVFIVALDRGASQIQTLYRIPATASSLLSGMILFFMLGCEFFINYQLIFRSRKEN